MPLKLGFQYDPIMTATVDVLWRFNGCTDWNERSYGVCIHSGLETML